MEPGTDVPALRVGRPPHHVVEDRERLASLASLTDQQRTALWLYGLGLSYGEIARRQGSSAHAIERQLKRARRTLARGGAEPRSAAPARERAAPRPGSARLLPARAAPPSGRAAAAR